MEVFMASRLNLQAEELNQLIKAQNSAVFEMLSNKGESDIFPP